MGLLVYTFLLMMRPLFGLVEMVLVRGIAGRDALSVIGSTIPHILVLTVPMSFLFGVLIAVGRMNSDNEIIALQAGGIPSTRILRPVVIMGLFLAAVNGWLYLMVIPDANRSMRDMRVALFANAKNIGRIEPGVFYEEFPNLLLYVREVADRGGRWRGVMIFDSTDPVEQRLTLARHGGIVTTGEGDSPTDKTQESGAGNERWILLEDVVNHQFNRQEPEAYRFSRSYQQVFRPDSVTRQAGVTRYQLRMRERETSSLVDYLTTGEFADQSDEDVELDSEEKALQRRMAMVELNRRVAIPFACVVFALLAVPLGVGSRSGGRGRGFIVSIAVILSYYVISNNGELMAVEGKIPTWFGVWVANLALASLGLVLIFRMGRWLGERQLPEGPIARWLRRRKEARRARAHAAGRNDSEALSNGFPVGLQRRRVASGFPAILDRYIIRRLLAPLALVIVSSSLLYVVIDLTDHVDEMAENNVPFEVIVGYYFNLIPQLILDVMPLALLIAVLVLLTVLERQQELTAFKAGGISLYRVVVPILLVASLTAGAIWVLSESVVPESNRKAKRLLDRIKGRDTAPQLYTSGGRQWLLSRDDNSFYSFLQFDEGNESMVRFTKLTIDESMELRFHLFASRVTYEKGAWIAQSGWFRKVEPDGTVDFELINGPTEVGIAETPDYFAHERRLPSEMTAKELGIHINELVDSGHHPARLIVRWHQKFAYPLSAFLMVFLALPYGLNRGGLRVTTMQGVALALVLGIVYYISVAFFGKLGEAEVLPAVIGAWSPAILVALFAVNRMTTLRT